MQARPTAFFRLLGQAAECARSAGQQAALGYWTQAFRQALDGGDEFGGWDRYGRFIGRARIRREGCEAALVDAWLPRGGLRPWVGMVTTELRRLGVERLVVEGRRRRLSLTPARLSRLAAAEPDRGTPLHPVLAGMAETTARDAGIRGQALMLLAVDPRHAALPLADALRRVQRAQGSGQLRLWTRFDGEPRGLLIWARPSVALLAALRDRSEQRFHAAEWNEGGEPVVLELCAADAASAREVAAAAIALPGADAARLHIRLDDAQGRSTLSSIHRAERDAFADWLAGALTPA